MKVLPILIFFLSILTNALSQNPNDSLSKKNRGYPVIIYSDTLFYIEGNLGSENAEERAARISKIAENLSDDFSYLEDSLKLINTNLTTNIVYDDKILLAVSDEDALSKNMERDSLAQKWFSILKKSISKDHADKNFETILIKIGIALLIIIIVFFFIKYVNKLFRLFNVKVYSLKKDFLNGIKIGKIELINVDTQVQALIIILKILKAVFIIFTLYFVFPVIFSLFPWTEGLSDTLFGYILNPLKSIFFTAVNYLPNLITVIIIVAVTRYIINLLKFIAKEIREGDLQLPGFYPDWAKPTFNIVRFIIYVFMIIIIFPYLPNSDSDIFKGVSIFLGVLVSFGSSSAISNVVAGLVLTYMRPFQIGDRVMVDNVTGNVTEKTLLVTRIRTIKNEEITIPNSKILANHSVNYSTVARETGIILHTTVTIGYDVDWRKVHELLINAAKDTNNLDNDKPMFVLQTSLNDFYVSYEINAYTNFPNKMAQIYSDLHQNIQDKFNDANIEIMSPHYQSNRDGNKSTVPHKSNNSENNN